jgi:hypothetical protein
MAANPLLTSDQVDSLLTLMSGLGEALVCTLMVRHNLWRKFPLFFAYLGWAFVVDLAALYLQNRANEHIYFRFFLVQTVVDSILMFAVLVELAWSVLRPVRGSLPRGTIVVLAVLVALAGLAIWPLAGKTVPSGYVGLSEPLFHLQQTVAILRMVCFLVMAGLSQVLSIGWRDRELQVVTGLGIFSIVSLLVTLIHSQQKGEADSFHFLDQAISISYLCTLSYWVFSFVTKEQKRKEFSPQMQHFLLQLGGGARAGRMALSDIPSKELGKKD